MKKPPLLLAALITSLACERPFAADIVSSFEIGDEGWTVVGLAENGSYAIPNAGPATPAFSNLGGNLGGHIAFLDAAGFETFYFEAPARFLGNQSASYGLQLLYDARTSGGNEEWVDADVVLVGTNGMALLFDSGPNPGSQWARRTVDLHESAGWHVDTLNGRPPTSNEFVAVISDMTALRIRGEFTYGEDTGYLDNVVLNTPAADDDPPSILVQPQGQVVILGSSVNFVVTADGAPPLSYQWLFNGANISGAASTNYIIPDAQTNHSGPYRVVVSNAFGMATSQVANLTVLPVTNYFYSGFEVAQDLDDWIISSGTWEIGVPTFGPPTNSLGRRAFAGTNCAATVLGGNYADNTSSRLESKSFVVPSTNQNPRLRFWHWYSFDRGDEGKVQVKVGTGAWQTISPTYTTTSGGIWSRPSLDLSSYAGRSVQVGFLFSAVDVNDGFGNQPETSAGWYLDEVAVVTGPITLNNPDGFELGLGDWSAEGGTWEVGVPTSGPGSAHDGAICAGTVLDGDYLETVSGANGVSSRLISPAFIVPPAVSNPRLRFWHWYSFDRGDEGKVQIKVGTNNWQTISPTYITTSGGVWTRPSLDLSNYAGRSVQVGFQFSAVDVNDGFGNQPETSAGWYVDEVAVVTGPITFNNPDGFELGLGDWSAEGGTWEVGVPTSGPGSAHDGAICAGTVLNGDYLETVSGANGVSSRLISPAFIVPPAVSNPRLRFWHWYSFNRGDDGEVQIKVGTNNWQTISPTYTTTSGGIWSRPSLDLSSYAGRSVQVGFLFSAVDVNDGFGNQPETSAGWYLDEVAVVTGPITLNNPDGFELGLGDWSAEGGTWEVGVPTSGPGSAHDGAICAGTVLDGDYLETVSGANGVSSRLISPAFIVPPAVSNPRLRFWHWYSFNRGDDGEVQIKVGTNNWQTISPTYTTTSGGIWSRPSLDLSSYAGQSVQVGFLFSAVDVNDGFGNQPETSAGWYVDEVRLLHDFGVLLLDSPIVRTQNTACVPLGIAASSPASTVSYTLQIPAGLLGNLALNTEGCWTGSLTPQPDSQWLIALQNNCMNAAMGVQTVGSLCFTAVSTESAFVPLSPGSLVVTNLDGSMPPALPIGSRPVIIADKPLLDAWLGPNRRRMVTTYGKPNTTYEISQATNVTTSSPWTPGWTNTVPASLSFTSPVLGSLSNASILYLRANER